MTPLLQKWLLMLRVWLGLSDPSEKPMTPAHGWLLPDPELLLSLRQPARVGVLMARPKA